jgi:protein-S-isoprenylcysteine O-methyltransferase Ste14
LAPGGAYARCRHPLYQSLLLALATVLSLKARREERRLCAIHSGYADYMTSTPAIIPFLPGLDWRVALDTATTR